MSYTTNIVRGRGKVWSLRLPVTQEVAGSNPVVPAKGQIAQSVELLSEKQGVVSSILPLATGFFPLKTKPRKNLYNLIMNFFQLIYAYIKKNLKTAQETEDSDERKKQWIKIVFGIVLALGYGGLHVPPNVSVSEVIYALGILFITLYVVFRALKYFKLI